ncbi:helix-turn-helix domain-containing protein [Flavisolibacter nicotianae]|uniref:helix-turn-helix domain-containing protein n=1 Tax=Flavisolibacter nicotianae TaxID=2364882 RepID=UPI000EB4AE64|nr:helix-turn-helix domain-containing protein [Flavisolibacter nicotianae]
MEAFYVPSEGDFKRWVKEAVQEYFQGALFQTPAVPDGQHDLMNRKDVAKLLQVSLVTLTDWMKRGLPFHKQRGRVYFIKAEVLDYIRESQSTKARYLSGINHFGC